VAIDWGDGLAGRIRSFLVGSVVVLLGGNAVALASHDGTSQAGNNTLRPEVTFGASAGDESAPTLPQETVPAVPKDETGTGGGEPSTGTGRAVPGTPGPDRGGLTAASPTTSTTRPPYTYEVTLEPTCALPGQTFTLTFKVEPGSAVGVIASHSDRQNHGTMWGTTAGSDGVVVRKWTVPPSPGPGRVLTGATTPDGRTGGTMLEFRIAEATDPC
jgi:hypothetical protein